MQAQQCDTVLNGNPGVYTLIDGNNLPGITAGSTICLKSGNYFQIRIDNLNGTANAPIIIRPENEEVVIDTINVYGIRFGKSSHIKLTGKTDNDPYAIKILRSHGVGVSIDDLSTDIEVEGLEIAHTRLAGIMAKTDPDCSFKSVRDSFAMYNIKIHDNYLHDIGFEGMYIGSSFYSGKLLNCNGKDTTVLPHLIYGVEVYNNIIQRTGYDAIQVSCAMTDCKIFSNQISYDSYVKQYGQMSGIIIGEGSSCDCYNNKIMKGSGIGIEVHGMGGKKIFNNLILEAGRTYKPLTQGAYSKPGIYVAYNLPNPQSLPYHIFSNTIVNPKSEGIRFSNINSANNLIYNNIVINPGIWNYYDSMGVPPESSYINFNVDVTKDVKNNFCARNATSILFLDTIAGNYRLSPDSPGVNSGFDLKDFNADFDFDYQVRPYGNAYDIGAYEYFPGQGTSFESPRKNELIRNIVLNKSSQSVILELVQNLHNALTISIFDMLGKNIYNQEFSPFSGNSLMLTGFQFCNGAYIFRTTAGDLIDTRKVVFFNN
jgi:hypothetical protein